jgi:small conductance mechanosensitive channel
LSEFAELVGSWLDPALIGALILQWSGRIVAALLVFLIGRWVALALTNWVAGAMAKTQVDQTLIRFLRSLLYMTLLVVVVLTAIGALGVPTTNFLAILGAAGLAIGLALKDSLSNFSSGVMLVFFRPFRVGDFVQAGDVSGTVDGIGIFNTVIKTGDNRVVTVPNSLIYAQPITNFSAEPTRRIDLVIGISYDDDIALAKSLIGDVLDAHGGVLADPPRVIFTLDLAESSVNLAVRGWVATPDYWVVRGDLLERIKAALEARGLSIPYPQRDLHIVGQPNGAA